MDESLTPNLADAVLEDLDFWMLNLGWLLALGPTVPVHSRRGSGRSIFSWMWIGLFLMNVTGNVLDERRLLLLWKAAADGVDRTEPDHQAAFDAANAIRGQRSGKAFPCCRCFAC